MALETDTRFRSVSRLEGATRLLGVGTRERVSRVFQQRGDKF
jgi:hypothetical protein